VHSRPCRTADGQARAAWMRLVIAGTHATLALPGPFYQPGDLLLTSADGSRQLGITWGLDLPTARS
jgi:hypothetical protein